MPVTGLQSTRELKVFFASMLHFMQNSFMKPFLLDEIDRALLSALQRDATLSLKALAALCHTSEATCSRRLAAMRKKKLFRQLTLADRQALGFTLCIHVLVRLENEQSTTMQRFVERLKKVPMVMRISLISGDYDYLLELVARDMTEYQAFCEAYLSEEPCVKKFNSLFEMKPILVRHSLPLD